MPRTLSAQPMVQASIRLLPELADKLHQAAAEQGKSRTQLINEIVTDWAKRRARKG